jgi:hypothetical protein
MTEQVNELLETSGGDNFRQHIFADAPRTVQAQLERQPRGNND